MKQCNEIVKDITAKLTKEFDSIKQNGINLRVGKNNFLLEMFNYAFVEIIYKFILHL